MEFGSNLAQIRKDRNITQQALSDATGFDKRMISRWESGNTKPNIEAAALLARALGVSLDVLTGLNASSNPDIDNLIAAAKKLKEEDLKAVLHIAKALADK